MSRTLDQALLKYEKMPSVNGDPIVESGSNVDGRWIKLATGKLICTPDEDDTFSASITVAVGSGYRTNNLVWTFPMPFSNSPAINVACRYGSGGGSAWPRFLSRSETTCTYQLLSFSSTSSTFAIDHIAIGES